MAEKKSAPKKATAKKTTKKSAVKKKPVAKKSSPKKKKAPAKKPARKKKSPSIAELAASTPIPKSVEAEFIATAQEQRRKHAHTVQPWHTTRFWLRIVTVLVVLISMMVIWNSIQVINNADTIHIIEPLDTPVAANSEVLTLSPGRADIEYAQLFEIERRSTTEVEWAGLYNAEPVTMLLAVRDRTEQAAGTWITQYRPVYATWELPVNSEAVTNKGGVTVVSYEEDTTSRSAFFNTNGTIIEIRVTHPADVSDDDIQYYSHILDHSVASFSFR